MTRSTQHNPQVHEVLRALREAAGLRQEVWADQLDVSRATVQRWERGTTLPNEEAERKIIEWAREYGMFRQFDRGVLQGITINEVFLHDVLLEARGARHTRVEEESDSEEPKESPIEGEEVHKPRRQVWVAYRMVLLVAGAVVMLLGVRDQLGTSTSTPAIPATPTPVLAATANPTLMSLYDDFNGPIIDESKWVLPDNGSFIYQADGVLNLINAQPAEDTVGTSLRATPAGQRVKEISFIITLKSYQGSIPGAAGLAICLADGKRLRVDVGPGPNNGTGIEIVIQ
jgi:transcriptional regulator with XRE-family HTH domain